MKNVVQADAWKEESRATLDELAREGARRMKAAALEVEVDEYVRRFTDERDAEGRAKVVRNGRGKERSVTMGAVTVRPQAPRVNDKREVDGERQRFTSKILPPYLQRSKNVSEVLPILYLRGLSTGDFREALPTLLGDDAAGLSPSAITRLVSVWQEEYATWRTRSLEDRDYVYVWADGRALRRTSGGRATRRARDDRRTAGWNEGGHRSRMASVSQPRAALAPA